MFHRIYKILISLETEQITFYNDLFCEIFLNKYRTQVKKNVNFITNVTKVKNFKRGINFSKSINLFLDFGLGPVFENVLHLHTGHNDSDCYCLNRIIKSCDKTHSDLKQLVLHNHLSRILKFALSHIVITKL